MLKPDIIQVPGPAGSLKTIYLPAQQSPTRGIAVINHLSPLQGDTNTNRVIQAAAKVLCQFGFHCCLPNLRGVSNSEDVHDYGRGETQDCTTAIDHTRSQHPDTPQFALAGSSFGGYVAMFAAQERTPDWLLLMDAAVHHYTDRPKPSAVPDVAKTLVIHGAKDEVAALDEVLAWAGPQDLPVVVLAGSSHFFHGKLIALRNTVLRFAPAISDWIPPPPV